MTIEKRAERITVTEAIERAGRVLFGKDWIGALTAKERALIKEHGPKGPAGRELIARCPDAKIRALDRALGRERRVTPQRGTVVEWLRDHSIELGRRISDPIIDNRHYAFCDVAALDKALAHERAAQFSALARGAKNGASRGPGRRADKTPAAAAAMEAAIEHGRITVARLDKMTGKELENMFGFKRAVSNNARKLVISKCEASAQN